MKKRKSGFSVLELCIAMAVMLIVGAMALPAFNKTIENYRLNASTNAMKDMLLQAQTAARKTDQPYYANPVSPAHASAQSASGAGSTPSAATVGTVTFKGAPPVNINDLLNALGNSSSSPGNPDRLQRPGRALHGQPSQSVPVPGPNRVYLVYAKRQRSLGGSDGLSGWQNQNLALQPQRYVAIRGLHEHTRPSTA